MKTPKLTIKTTPGDGTIPDTHDVEGWEELDRWARCNHPHWHKIRQRTDRAEMYSVDKAKLLAGEMLWLNVELQAKLTDAAMRDVIPVVVVTPKHPETKP